jgi:ABC-type multidrug transport system ATPase subunit
MDLVRSSIGLVFQDTTLDDYMTAEQNLRFHALAYGVPPEVRDVRLKSLMEMVELWPRRKDRTRTYSGGMRRRLEIARGLLHQPKVLFLDEPTIGLDPQTRNKIWGYIHELRKQIGLTIFMTTHYMDEADLNCDRIGIIDKGVLPAAAAERSPLSHVLSQAVGHQESEIWPEISSLDLEPGDTLLLCTDGLTKHVAEAGIAETLAKASSAREACGGLVDAALQDGGSDNVTVVVTRFLT